MKVVALITTDKGKAVLLKGLFMNFVLVGEGCHVFFRSKNALTFIKSLGIWRGAHGA